VERIVLVNFKNDQNRVSVFLQSVTDLEIKINNIMLSITT
jgi:hypothetical protein